MLTFTRVWLPIGIAVVGIVAIVVGHARTATAGAGVVLLGTALIVWMINWLFRMSIESNKEREQEEEARRFFDEHGRWPDE
jgi:ABC-type transport system involved in cytochrome bd biosynthesis fused ATPase/permease subunit